MSDNFEQFKTVLELDLVSYGEISIFLEENLSVEAVEKFENQIQQFVDSGLDHVGLKRHDVVVGTAGDNAILLFNDVVTMHRFSKKVHQETLIHNQNRSVELAKRWFRMGAATGTVRILESERRIIGTTIARAVRLEAAAKKGQLVIDNQTFVKLPNELKDLYSNEEIIKGKHDNEIFKVHRCNMINIEKKSIKLPLFFLILLFFIFGGSYILYNNTNLEKKENNTNLEKKENNTNLEKKENNTNLEKKNLTALDWEEKGFNYLLEKNINDALYAFSKAEEIWPDYHHVSEIRVLLNNEKDSDENDNKWKRIFSIIISKYSWGIPSEIKKQMDEFLE
ncbi:MAG: adenylate/guanylate cyclase domain-containing protein [Desulfobacterales bacterium]|nr:adenylate/guanylate cyclase domain-containing protein [Desulfobacterales bacterium]